MDRSHQEDLWYLGDQLYQIHLVLLSGPVDYSHRQDLVHRHHLYTKEQLQTNFIETTDQKDPSDQGNLEDR